MKKYNSGNTNTILIVIVLVIIVAFAVWWFTMRSAPADDSGTNVNVTLPGGNDYTVPTGSTGGSAVE